MILNGQILKCIIKLIILLDILVKGISVCTPYYYVRNEKLNCNIRENYPCDVADLADQEELFLRYPLITSEFWSTSAVNQKINLGNILRVPKDFSPTIGQLRGLTMSVGSPYADFWKITSPDVNFTLYADNSKPLEIPISPAGGILWMDKISPEDSKIISIEEITYLTCSEKLSYTQFEACPVGMDLRQIGSNILEVKFDPNNSSNWREWGVRILISCPYGVKNGVKITLNERIMSFMIYFFQE